MRNSKQFEQWYEMQECPKNSNWFAFQEGWLKLLWYGEVFEENLKSQAEKWPAYM